MAMNNRALHRGTVVLLISLAVIRGVNFTAIKTSLTGLTPLLSSGIRNGLAGSALLGYALVMKRPLWPSAPARRKLLGMGAIFALNFFIVYTAMNYTTASRASILLNSQPLVVALFTRFFVPSDRVTRRKMTGLMLAFLGVMLVLGDRESSIDFSTIRGDLLALLAALNWAVLVILRKQVAQEVDPGVVAAWEVIVGALTLIPLAWLLDHGKPMEFSTPVLLSLIYSGFIAGALVFGANIHLIKNHDVNAVSSFNFMIPVIGTTAGILFLKEPFGSQIIVGMTLVALGIYVVNRPSHSGGKAYA